GADTVEVPPWRTTVRLPAVCAPSSCWSRVPPNRIPRSPGTSRDTMPAPEPPPTGRVHELAYADDASVERTEPPARTAKEPTAIRPRVAVTSTPTIASPSAREPTSSATERPARSGRSVHAESRTGGRPAKNNATSITASVSNGFITTNEEWACLVVTPSTTVQCPPGSDVQGSAPIPASLPPARITQATAAH